VANTHLFWDPNIESIKYYQMTKLLKTVREAAKPEEPIIVAGDTNSTPQSNLIQFIQAGSPPDLSRTLEPEDNFTRLN
jgi:endonuclease/exonuclease/phosphatase (EEP) superfamily protein YafD